MLAGLVVIAAALDRAGLLVTRVIEHAWGIGAADERVNVWLAAHRTPGRTHASLIGSIVAGGVVLPILVGVIGLASARSCGNGGSRLSSSSRSASKSATYRLTTLVIHSHRPRVVRLEQPAGQCQLPVRPHRRVGRGLRRARAPAHIQVQERVVRVLVWTLAVAMVAFVAMSRMYRGMHHPLDVGGGLLVGIAALAVARLRVPAAGAVYDSRHGGEA